eukprot:jgi/Sobl393_1/881/SZX75543.1
MAVLYTASDTRRVQVEVAVAARSAGLLTALPAACGSAAHMFELLLQQQQQQLASAVMELAVALLKLLDVLAQEWPESSSGSSSDCHSWLSCSSGFCRAALPAVRLSVAVLVKAARQEDILWPINVTIQVCSGLIAEVSCSSLGSRALDAAVHPQVNDQDSQGPPTKQLLRSTELLRLLAAAQALRVQQLACLLCRRRSSSSRSSGGGTQSTRAVNSQRQAAAAAAAWASGHAGSSSTAQLLQAAGFPQLQQVLASPAALAAVLAKADSCTELAVRLINKTLEYQAKHALPVHDSGSSGSSSSRSAGSSTNAGGAQPTLSSMHSYQNSCNTAQQQQQQQQQQHQQQQQQQHQQQQQRFGAPAVMTDWQ